MAHVGIFMILMPRTIQQTRKSLVICTEWQQRFMKMNKNQVNLFMYFRTVLVFAIQLWHGTADESLYTIF